MTHTPQEKLAARDASKPNTEQGLYRKFEVNRTDGSDGPGGKHEGCEYFVLDVNHDPAARPALAAYAQAIRATHPQLADDIIERYGLSEHGGGGEAVAWRVTADASVAEFYNDDERDRIHLSESDARDAAGDGFTITPLYTTPSTTGAPVVDDEFADLRTFYNVETDAELIRIQAQHVERLQEILPRNQPLRAKPRFA